jgi:nicotinamidase-related amidase
MGPDDLDDFVASLLRRLEGSRGRGPLPDLSRSALVLLDLQRVFLDPVSPAFIPSWPAAAPRAARLVAAFRAAALPVIRTRHVHPDGDGGGTLGAFFNRLLTGRDPLAAYASGWECGREDVEVQKNRHSAFSADRMERSLAERSVSTVVLAGVQAQLCVLATAVEAGSRDVMPVIAVDAVAAPTREMHVASMQAVSSGLAWLATTKEIAAALEGRGGA